MSWKNEFAGSSEILSWEPPGHLRLAWGGTGAQVTDYHIEGEGGTTVLRVVTSGFPEDASWDEWVEGTRLGWLFELTSLRRYLEHHDGEDRRVVYLRRRIGLDRQDAWDRLFGPGGFDPGDHGGRALHVEEPRQYVAVTEDPAGALLRVSTEPCGPGVDGVDVTFFLSVWGDEGAADGPAVIESRWDELLERRFPEGERV